MNMTRINFVVYVNGKVYVVFNRNCLLKVKDFSRLGPLQAIMHTVVVSKKWREIDTLLLHSTNRKYHMTYLFVPFPMTLDDLESHSRDAGLIKCNTIRRTFVRHLARFSLTRRVARSLGDS